MACPLCHSDKCTINNTVDGVKQINCDTYKTKIQMYLSNYYDDKDLYFKLLNLICEKIIREPKSPDGRFWKFYYDPTETEDLGDNDVNLYLLMRNYPTSIIDITNRALVNLSLRYKSFGEEFFLYEYETSLYFPQTMDNYYEDAEGVLKMLHQMGYIVLRNHAASISAEGWKKIESLRKEQQEIKQGFVAMRFGSETAEIREGFRTAISDAGYVMRAIDEKEHNNQIVPEILYEIERSKFVVVDVTYPNYGAYYEAGFAQGLGKQVIVCCKKEVFENKEGKYERPHFDISQKSMVIWEDIEDLKFRLKKRIEATVR